MAHFIAWDKVKQFSALKKRLADCRAVGISFQRAAKPYLIPSNGSLAPELFTAQPQKMAACAEVALPACTRPLTTALGAFDELRRICVAAL
jgi:hypothetical protein